jgi:hypothetical protein
MFFYLIDIAIVVGLAGLIFIIIGIVKKKAAHWIAGIALTVIASLLVVYAFARVINKTNNFFDRVNRWERKIDKKLEQVLPDTIEEKTHYDTVFENNKMKVRLYKGKDIAGFIKGTDNKLTLIKIKLSKPIKNKGISIDKILEEYSLEPPKKNLIPLSLCFSRDFKSRITLSAYGLDKKEISSSTISCSALKGEEKKVVFEFEKSLKLSDIDYCIIYDSTQ